MATGRVPTTANSPLTAKGDLFGYSTTQARVAVGNNGETLVADSSATTGLRYQGNYAAGKNAIINGAFNVWQRGTTFNGIAANTYNADRFVAGVSGSSTVNISAQALTPGSITGYDSPYFYRYAISSIGTGVDGSIYQRIENVQTLAGQTVTFSFWAKADSSRGLAMFASQNFGSGGSTQVTTTMGYATATTGWARYSITVALPSISGKTIGTSSYLGISIYFGTTAGFTLDTWGWQLEAGSVATAFQTATGTLQGELAACQRYYWRSQAGGQYNTYANGGSFTTTGAYINVPYPVTMRVNPTAMEYANLAVQVGNGAITALSSLTIDQQSNFCGSLYAVTGSTWTANQPARLLNNNNTAGYLAFTSEL
jgi:hypothetical protein